MNNQPVSLTLELENCDSLIFEWRHVQYITIGGITESINYYNGKSLVKRHNKWCEKFYITVEEEGGEYSFDSVSGEHWTKRLVDGDITSICIEYEDGTRDVYDVVWPEGYEYYHPHQGVKKDHNGAGWNIYCNKYFKQKDNAL